MKFQYFDDQQKLMVYFDEVPQNHMMSLFNLICADLQRFGQIKYFITIDGAEGTLDTFVESCRSDNYHLYDNGRYNWLIKYLPTLCMLSNQLDDIITFYEFIGSFNEGQMHLLFLDSNFSFKFENEKEILLCKVKEHCFIEINVFPDGDVFEITSGSVGYDFTNIVNWLKQNVTILN